MALESNVFPRILVVEDEPVIRQFTAEVLVQSGFEVDIAPDAATAWEALNDDIYYDLLITDNTLPRLTGIELLKKLRAARMIVPVITTTMKSPAQKSAASPWLQPAATLVKPFAGELLLGTVQKVLRATDSSHAIAAPPGRPSLPAAIHLQIE